MYVSEIHSAVRSCVEQIYNISPEPRTQFAIQTGKGDMLYVSEIHSAVRSRVEQIYNISPEPRAQFAMSDRRGGM